jgi:hypothetical protein
MKSPDPARGGASAGIGGHAARGRAQLHVRFRRALPAGRADNARIDFRRPEMPRFQLSGIAHEPFESLFLLPDERLGAMGIARRFATETPGFPCRVSLEDAAIGEELLLLPYEHQPAPSPYRASGPVFVRRHARRRVLAPGEVPPSVSRRLISLRAYDAADMMVAASVCEGTAVAGALERTLSDPGVAYVHLHNARQGCFSCEARRP